MLAGFITVGSSRARVNIVYQETLTYHTGLPILSYTLSIRIKTCRIYSQSEMNKLNTLLIIARKKSIFIVVLISFYTPSDLKYQYL